MSSLNAATLTKWYSHPSVSFGRWLRVVCETDRRNCGSCASSARTSEVLPAPDGAAMTNRRPRFMGGNIARRPQHR